MPIISASSIMVTVLMGKLKTSPKQAHFIFRLFKTACNTPIMLTVITVKVKISCNLFKKFMVSSFKIQAGYPAI